MKTILVVEDTIENMDAAKSFFSTISGFEFVYAVNRKEAEILLPSVGAVITDRSLPYDGALSDLDWGGINGYLIAIHAKAKKIPVVLITYHGDLGIGEVIDTAPEFAIVKEIAIEFFGKKMIHFSNEHNILNEHTNGAALAAETVPIDWTGKKISKTSQEAWMLVWERLLKQF